MHNNIINNLLNLKGVNVKNIKNVGDYVEVFINTKVKPHNCPVCNNITTKIHDYRKQVIKDIPIQLTPTYLIFNKRRYVCKHCHKKFYEKLEFLPKYHRTTSRLNSYIIDSLKDIVNMKYVGKNVNVSPSTVCNRFDLVEYLKPKYLPEVLSIDEFKGNTNNTKYQCILVDAKNHRIIDILPDRKQTVLIDYFKSFKNRDSVKYFVIDMWKPYADIGRTYFKNALIIADKYHYVRQNIWAFEKIRKREQKRLGKHSKKLFRNSRRILLSKPNKLSDDDKMKLNSILAYSEDLRQAYYLKQLFFEFSDSSSYDQAKKNLIDFILIAQNSGITEYINLAKTLTNWSEEILNSFKVPYTNGCTEGFNNKIKVLKRIAFGFRNFKTFRNRILHCCS